MDQKKRQNYDYQESEAKRFKPGVPQSKAEQDEQIARIRRQISEKLKDLEKKNPHLNSSTSSIGGGFSVPPNPLGGSVRPTLDSTARAIQEAKERAMARLSNFPQFANITHAPERDQGRKGLGLKVEAHPSLQHLFEKTTSDTGKIPFNLIPKANFATTKANQRVAQAATKKKQMKVEKPDIEAFADPSKNPYYDPNLAVESLAPKSRISRHLRFNKQGKYIELANQMRTQARLEKLKQEIADSVKKTGMDVELDLVSDMSVKKEAPPNIEWWDAPLMKNPEIFDPSEEGINFDTDHGSVITLYIQHPVQINPPVDMGPPPPKPLMLTKKERKKLRRQRRLEEQRDKQDKIRMGLLPPDQPKVKISNLMRVLGNEAVLDPTKVEAQVREQMKSRQDAHKKHNEEKKLTKEERREKLKKKLMEDTSKVVQVAVFKVNDLSDGQKRYKVDINAQQLYLTGIVIVCPTQCMVVVEGGPKGIKQYKKLMLRRIDWSDSKKMNTDEEQGDEGEKEEGDNGTGEGETSKEKKENKCFLVWEGSIKERLFKNGFKFKPCPTEYKVQETLEKFNATHYWELVKNYVEPSLV
ncbi:pre-mRNA processing factor 3-domain-containing protein [Neocallimastix lanati (nom. inval.)]|jgi:U4/U6 small nuclear ribonucleoprotein PRP3|nr:pre-mRNA processing factor 3-domain-containing protein [Neocallimastix sp. JGI-2020a]